MGRTRRARVDGIFDWLRGRRGPARPVGPPPPDYYAILGVSPAATDDEIRVAYRDLARRFHPDRNPGDPVAAERFAMVQAAYEALRDPESRSMYDRIRGAAAPTAEPPPTGPRELVPTPVPLTPFERFARAFPPPPPAAPAPPPRRPRPRPGEEEAFWMTAFGLPPPEIVGERFQAFPAPAPPPPPPPRAPAAPPAPARARAPWEGRTGPTEPPRREEPPSEFGVRPPPPPVEGFPRPEEMAAFMAEQWPLEGIWDVVRMQRTSDEFQRTGTVVVDRLAGATPGAEVEREISDWLNIDREVADLYERRGLLGSTYWTDVLYPIFNVASEAFRLLKPRDLPGEFVVGQALDVPGVDLYYMETAGARRLE